MPGHRARVSGGTQTPQAAAGRVTAWLHTLRSASCREPKDAPGSLWTSEPKATEMVNPRPIETR